VEQEIKQENTSIRSQELQLEVILPEIGSMDVK
jgi:hypothetical protein